MKTHTHRRRWLILGLGFLLAAASLPLLNAEIRSFLLFKLAPAYARDAHFVRLSGKEEDGTDRDVFLLGTIHRDHMTSADYSLWHVAAAVENLKPDLVLVESRPEELARDNWGDGAIEMLVASLTARGLGIPVDGIDWWQKADSQPGTSNPAREQHMFENVKARLPAHRRVLVLVGYSHVPELAARLEEAGLSRSRFDRAEKQALFSSAASPQRFPPGMRHYLQKRIDLTRDEIETESDARWKSALEANLALRQELLKLVDEVGEQTPR